MLNKLMISCQKSAELVHKKLNLGLNTSEKVKLKFHTSMCGVCKTFERQTQQLEELIKRRLEVPPTDLDLTEFKSETISKIKQ